MAFNPYEKYKEQQISTLTKGEMVIVLYDEIIKQLTKSILFIEEKNIEAANQCLFKSQQVIDYLTATLDPQYPVSQQLALMYDFFDQQIKQSNIKKDTSYIADILPMITDLKLTFAQADKLTRM